MRRLSLLCRRWSLAVALPLVLGACSGAPSGTPSCSAASIADVMTALENVSGYTFIASGTSLNPTIQTFLGPGPYEYQSPSPRIELGGAYRAPDRSRLEVLAGRDAHPPLSAPGMFFLGADAIVKVGDRMWLVGGDGEPTTTDPGRANLLLNVLRGDPEVAEVEWSSPNACSFEGQTQRGSMSISVQVDVGPGSLPSRIIEEFRFDQPNRPRIEYNLTYQPDFGQAPEIEAPGS